MTKKQKELKLIMQKIGYNDFTINGAMHSKVYPRSLITIFKYFK